MYNARLRRAGGLGQCPGEGVPCHALVLGDVEVLAQGVGIGHQSGQGAGKVAVVGDGPEHRAVAGDEDRFSLPQAAQQGVGLLRPQHEGNIPIAIGIAGSHDGQGEALLTVGRTENALA